MSINVKLSTDLTRKSVDQTFYRNMIGSLLYLTANRSDIFFSVGVCAHFQANPKESYLIVVKCIIQYVTDTMNHGIWYSKNTYLNLARYSDADQVSCVDDRKSTSGGCFYMGTNLVAQLSKKQNSISLSTMEAEYIAARSCCTQLLWMKKLLLDCGLDQEKIVVFCDNQSAINLSKNPIQHSRTKHIDIKYHFICDLVETNVITLDHVATE